MFGRLRHCTGQGLGQRLHHRVVELVIFLVQLSVEMHPVRLVSLLFRYSSRSECFNRGCATGNVAPLSLPETLKRNSGILPICTFGAQSLALEGARPDLRILWMTVGDQHLGSFVRLCSILVMIVIGNRYRVNHSATVGAKTWPWRQ